MCNNDMVLRTAKKGPNAGNQFYGCSGYPSCRGTRQV
ncbi:MAG: topoisomerase DNA-binding C4 zinc finger domain-containing protein [Paraglaciecola sp.]|nr:topoisomerase DNA-binding C4 zinc finger domain-containing protein [Paraglaciecola sp.]